MDLQRAAGQGEAKAHYKTHRGAFGAPRRRRGRLGLWVLLRFRLTLAGRAPQVHALSSELVLRSELVLEISQIVCVCVCVCVSCTPCVSSAGPGRGTEGQRRNLQGRPLPILVDLQTCLHGRWSRAEVVRLLARGSAVASTSRTKNVMFARLSAA